MADIRTAVSEIVTGLGLLGLHDLERALTVRPRSITHVDEVIYDQLDEAFSSGAHRNVFETAWSTGQRFARASEGLRGRRPWLVEWKGTHKPPAYELIPADLRVDHVYLISCKYGSKILQNASPWNLFERALVDRERHRADWFAEVAPRSYQEFYRRVCDHVGDGTLPANVVDLDATERKRLRGHLPSGRWSGELRSDWELMAFEISRESASRLLAQLTTQRDREEFLWRILRLQAAPYYVLGADLRANELCYRVTTPWDFRARYTLRSFDMWGEHAGQPLVRWRADVFDRESATDRVIDGHVEVRWSHGKFGGVPEAKIYLDTPHHDVAGYQPLGES